MTRVRCKYGVDKVGGYNLYQGGCPAPVDKLGVISLKHPVLEHGKEYITDETLRPDLIVLAAQEYAPSADHFEGARVLYCPYNDSDEIEPEDLVAVRKCAREVARALKNGETVLVTCHQGRNRSGLISALALKELGRTADEAIKLVQSARSNALSNGLFRSIIHREDKVEPGHIKKEAFVGDIVKGLGLHAGENWLNMAAGKAGVGKRLAQRGLEHGLAGKSMSGGAHLGTNLLLGPEAMASYQLSQQLGQRLSGLSPAQRDAAIKGVLSGTEHSALKGVHLSGDVLEGLKNYHGGRQAELASTGSKFKDRVIGAVDRHLGGAAGHVVGPDSSRTERAKAWVGGVAPAVGLGAASMVAAPISTTLHLGTNAVRSIAVEGGKKDFYKLPEIFGKDKYLPGADRMAKAVGDFTGRQVHGEIAKGLKGEELTGWRRGLMDYGISPSFGQLRDVGGAVRKDMKSLGGDIHGAAVADRMGNVTYDQAKNVAATAGDVSNVATGKNVYRMQAPPSAPAPGPAAAPGQVAAQQAPVPGPAAAPSPTNPIGAGVGALALGGLGLAAMKGSQQAPYDPYQAQQVQQNVYNDYQNYGPYPALAKAASEWEPGTLFQTDNRAVRAGRMARGGKGLLLNMLADKLERASKKEAASLVADWIDLVDLPSEPVAGPAGSIAV